MSNEEQREQWNGETGEQWVAQDRMLAEVLEPVVELLLKEIPEDRQRVLNIGCGGGSESLRVIEALDDSASLIGVDISSPLLEVAEQRRLQSEAAERLQFLHADASSGDLGGDNFDLIVSRFGVMFFDDPTQAFSHMRNHASADSRLLFACWRSMQENPWLLKPLKAALEYLPAPPPPEPHAPGPFAFADAERLQNILANAGWRDIEIKPQEFKMRWAAHDGLRAGVDRMLAVGPTSRMLREADEETASNIRERVVELLTPDFENNEIALEGAIWIVSASNS